MRITDYPGQMPDRGITEYRHLSEMWETSVSRYAGVSAVIEGEKTYTYRELDQAVRRFRGYLKDKGYRPGGTMVLASRISAGFVKAFLAAETLGLCVTVLPEGTTETMITPEEYEKDVSGTDTDVFFPEREDAAVVMYTGGTTGIPKGAILSHRCVMVAIRNACYGYPNVFGQKYLHVLPMHHVFGLIRSMLTCLATGGTLILCPNPRNMGEVAQRENPTISVLVPLLVDRGVSLTRRTGRSWFGNAMKTIITGAAPVAEHLASECRDLGICLCPGYGLTETACLVSGNPDMEGHPGSVGLLYPEEEVRFVDGELQLRGRNLMTGYVGAENGFTQDGWFATGDVGYLDEDGYLYLLGRKKEMLLTANGENVYPAPVEARFQELPEVEACELFEGEDGLLHLEVLPRNPETYLSDDSPAAQALMNRLKAVNETLAKHERAAVFTIRTTDFPRTKSMKMVRRGNLHGQI